ncbi:histone-binding protein RBBP4 [Fistulifera solaris]|uniref:Histone-binding protein RBBP4 n=1 Tax=Fistulifera solaris TaxID=1519565 RepID=A0A1Z5K978_FISSO|nr:histone-binding protein RBBP4 [Fistulifera solaris]|eukprot:GAX22829.1 histone-binding protein RBBP4 [Fistulifera solaris]
MTNVAGNDKESDVLEERLIENEYKIWKKNTPYLYDFVMTHSQEWPSLTIEWLPTVRHMNDQVSEHSLLLGTHTTGNEPNYLMVAVCGLPNGETVVDHPQRYDEDKKEVGGYGQANAAVGKLEIKMKVVHEGEVNRARHMPGNPFMVASRGPSPEIYFWDLSKHPSFPVEGKGFCPEGIGIGHSQEGYPLEWSKLKEGFLLSGSSDTTVQLWDIAPLGTRPGTKMNSVATFRGHTQTVEDVDWHAKDEHMFASVGHDKKINIWDMRKTDQASHSVVDAHDRDINGVAFNPVNEFTLATASTDKTVKLWDLRNLKKPINTLVGHADQVYKVEWCPQDERVLASCSEDRRVAIWDLSRIGREQSPEDAEDGPPELLFLHGGHTGRVSDFSWNHNEAWTIASVSEDNVLQIWNVAEEIYTEGDDGDDQSSGEGEDGLLSEDEDDE